METAYNPKEIEKKWQKNWEENNFCKIDKDDKTTEKFYILDMFPYPSGTGLHMGHTESYTASDVYYRFKKMQGYNVLHPQGFDAFGLPAENYAIKTGVKPAETTKKNIENYIRQMQSLGFAYDFSEQAVTSDPEYYKWTQWIFGEFFKNGLVYKKTQKTNWCSSCQTVIANEQVMDGKCERCGTEIEQRELPGWFFKITDFAEELIADLDKVDWPEHTKKNQRNWIGKSTGTTIKFQVLESEKYLEVFTTRVDTIFGCTYCVVAPEHKIISELKAEIENFSAVEAYIEKAKNKTELSRMEAKEKTGVEMKGVKVVNPFTGENVPMFVADYVLGNYGTGAVMAVPAHDERDFEFAKTYGLPVKDSIAPYLKDNPREDKETEKREVAVAIIKNPKDNTYLCLSWNTTEWKSFPSGGVDGEDLVVAAKREVMEETGYRNLKFIRQIGDSIFAEFYRPHKDSNVFANFKYVLFELENEEQKEVAKKEKDQHGFVWVAEAEVEKFLNVWNQKLAWKKYHEGDFAFVEDGIVINSGTFDGLVSEEAREKMTAWLEEKGLGKKVVNYRLRDWSISRQRYWGCPIPIVYSPEGVAHLVPKEHLPWTLPEDVDFVPTGVSPLEKSVELKKRTEEIFGAGWTAEYDTMDTFVDSAWYFLRYPDPHNNEEFCSKERMEKWLPVDLYIGGAEHTYMHLLFARFFVKAMHRIGILNFDEPFLKLRHQGMVLDKEGKKMSKSKGNVINPDEMVEKFGADSVRAYMLFAAPLEDDVMWNENNIVGVRRFLEKIWKLQEKVSPGESSEQVKNILHKTIKKVGEDIETMKFNTAISAMMILANELEKQPAIAVGDYAMFLQLLAPFAPHIAEELWLALGKDTSIFSQRWPQFEENFLRNAQINLAVQINGKLRDVLVVDAEIAEEAVKEFALASEKIKNHLAGKEIKKIIFVPGKLLSIVI